MKDLETGRLSWVSQWPQRNHKYPYKRKVKMPKLGYVIMGKKVRERFGGVMLLTYRWRSGSKAQESKCYLKAGKDMEFNSPLENSEAK